MARTTIAEVQLILDTSLTDANITAYIAIANEIVTDELGSSGLSDGRLELIEQYLTAHLITTTKERMGIKERLGEAEITYMGVFGKGLQSTPYGQMLIILDTSRTLESLGKKAISITAITSFET